MKKNNLIAIVALIILLVGIVVVAYFTKEDSILSKDKLFSFNEYNIVKNNIELLSNQNNIDNEIFQKIESGEYSIDEPLLLVNPYDVSPLTAIIGFKTDESAEVTVTIKAKNNGKDLVYTTKESKVHYIPIYGLYMDYLNKVELKINDQTKSLDISVEAEDLEEYFFPDIVIEKNKLPEEDNDFYFVSTPLGTFVAAYDQTGEIRWFLKSHIHKQLTRLSNGNFLLGSPEIIKDESLGFIEIDLLGKIYNSYNLSDSYLHNYIELPNGNILYSTTNNRVIEFSLKTGEVIKTYDINQILKDVDPNILNSLEEKFDLESLKDFHLINSLDYDTTTDSILVGIYHYSTLINLNKNGKINWMLANPEYYSSKFSEYLLKPTNENFVYPMGNHNSKFENGKLTVMNNGWDLSKTTACSSLEGLKSSAVDYTIDSNKKTITETWKFEKNYISFTWGDYTTNADSKLIMFGRDFIEFHEPIATCKLPEEGDFVSHIIVLENDEEIFTMQISNSYNHVSKMSIVNKSYDFKKIIPKSYTSNQPSDSYEEINYKNKYKDSVLNNVPFELSGNKLKALYYEENFKIVLMDEYGKGYKYSPVNNEVNVKKGIGKTLILIEGEGEIYNTGYYIDL